MVKYVRGVKLNSDISKFILSRWAKNKQSRQVSAAMKYRYDKIIAFPFYPSREKISFSLRACYENIEMNVNSLGAVRRISRFVVGVSREEVTERKERRYNGIRGRKKGGVYIENRRVRFVTTSVRRTGARTTVRAPPTQLYLCPVPTPALRGPRS